MEKTFVQGHIRECCLQADNLIDVPQDRPGVTVRKCRICGRRHYRLKADLSNLIRPKKEE